MLIRSLYALSTYFGIKICHVPPFQNPENYGEHDKRKVHETGSRVESQLKSK
jgi:hypothetical protein